MDAFIVSDLFPNILDRIYRIHRIYSQVPDELEKAQAANGGKIPHN
jgi:hypothetical protein